MERSRAEIPRLIFEHAFALDTAVASHAAKGVDQVRQWDQLMQWIPTAERRWSDEGEPLLTETIRLLKRAFGRRELSVALTMSDLPSMSYPLVVNVSPMLPPAPAPPLPWAYFFTTLHHELLHRYLNENFSDDVLRRSPLLRKYIEQGEKRMVTGHLHLLAVQLDVYSRLGRTAELEEINRSNATSKETSYRRAWEIVSRVEPEGAFVAELLFRGPLEE